MLRIKFQILYRPISLHSKENAMQVSCLLPSWAEYSTERNRCEEKSELISAKLQGI
jgi:hypothetical protein